MTTPAIVMSKAEREAIVTLFATQKTLAFTAIEKATGLRSNHLVYFLKQLQAEGILVKNGDAYDLTIKGQGIIPHLAHHTGKEQPPLCVAVVAIVRDGKICLLQRNKMPYKGLWGLVGGKLKHDETIPAAAVREVKEETGLDVRFEKFCGVMPEHVIENGIKKHSFLLFLCKASVIDGTLSKSPEGEVAWFDIKALAEDTIIPSDLWMIRNLLPKKEQLSHATMMDDNGTYSFDVTNY